MENVKNNKKDKIRIIRYTTEGRAIITHLDFDGKKINYTYDSTRDGMGEQKIDKKKFNKDNICKSGPNYHMKNKPDNILIF